MAVKYWIANEPNSTITAAIAQSIATNLSTQLIGLLVAGLTTGNVIQVDSVDVSEVVISSSVADIGSAIINITVSPTSAILATTVNSSGTIGGALTDSGLIKVLAQGTTGDTVTRYIKLWSS